MKKFFTLLLIIQTLFTLDAKAQLGSIVGRVISGESNAPIEYATITIANQYSYATTSQGKGQFELKAPIGEQTLVVSYIGYEEYSQPIKISAQRSNPLVIKLKPMSKKIKAVVVKGEGAASRVNKRAFNVEALAIGDLKNVSANLSDALSKMNGVRIRDTGGVGSESKISLDGFSGEHIKIFIDGAPMNTSNSSFSLSNIPANYAERIEVYNGVAPIEFGTDALGGVINIVTKDQRVAGWDLDASYSYGSFNTHKSDLSFTHQLEQGLQYKVTAYQNYSDNNYKIDNTVQIFEENGLSSFSDEVYTVERFHDTYHNEAIIAEVGVRRKSWADMLNLSFNASQYYREIQTGTKQDVVYGARLREGYSLIPTLKYSKRDLLAKGLDIKANANYNYGITTVVDTTVFAYNWFGDTQYKGSFRSSTYTQRKDNSWSFVGVASYKIAQAHTASLSYSRNAAARVSRSVIAGTVDEFDDFTDPYYTTKGITGLSYMYKPSMRLDAQGFLKYYTQKNDGKTYSDSGKGTEHNAKNSYAGYGGAASYFIVKALQVKASYEMAYRLPTTTELFGNGDLEVGSIDLKPESSSNYNAGLSFTQQLREHSINLNGGIIYRYTQDYIIRTVSSDGESASYSNHGQVETTGWNVAAKYNFGELFSLGGSFNILNARDKERYVVGTTGQLSATYGEQIPNEPFKYASVDSRINFDNVISRGDQLYLVYDIFYQYEFPLYWEKFGDPSTKSRVPTQLAHNIAINYNLKGGRYNFSLECKNITNEKLYDNYSLQKAGRAFYGKVRINIGSVHKYTRN